MVAYNNNPILLAALPKFKVHLGFGLHAGEAIEGALGSELKIDVSYLSEHVSLSSRLEELTKEYHKCFLFTNTIFNLI